MKKILVCYWLCIAALLSGAGTALAQESSEIEIVAPEGHLGDTLFVEYWNEIVNVHNFPQSKNRVRFPVMPVEGRYVFQLPTGEETYFRYGWGFSQRGTLLSPFVTSVFKIDNGDSIVIEGSTLEDITFTGKGSEKYRAWQSIVLCDKVSSNNWWDLRSSVFDRRSIADIGAMIKERFDYVSSGKLSLLERSRHEIPESDYARMYLEIMSMDHTVALDMIDIFLLKRTPGYFRDCPDQQTLQEAYSRLFVEMDLKEKFPEKVINSSLFYPAYLGFRTGIQMKIENRFDYDSLFTGFHGRLKERLLTIFFINNSRPLDTQQLAYSRKRLSRDVRDPVFTAELGQSVMKGTEDTSYLDMQLTDQYGKTFRLSDFRGKAVFIDFWFTGCAGCSGYYQTVVSHAEKRADRDKVVFVTLCVDKDRDVWLESVSSGDYTSGEAVNVLLEGGTASPIVKTFGLVGFPQPVLLDTKGRIFSTSSQDLRYDGPEGLLRTIDLAYMAK